MKCRDKSCGAFSSDRQTGSDENYYYLTPEYTIEKIHKLRLLCYLMGSYEYRVGVFGEGLSMLVSKLEMMSSPSTWFV